MSGAAPTDSTTAKGVVSDRKDPSQPLAPQKPAAQLEEDDEFEDFPVEGTRNTHQHERPASGSIFCTRARDLCDPALHVHATSSETNEMSTDWPAEEELGAAGTGAGTTHLWEESWDDDDTSEDFSKQLK